MKKILLATTVLVGTAGFASAEVTLSGNGRLGIAYNETALVGDKETSFNSRIRATVNMSSSTDGGLEFGGSFGIHDSVAAAAGTEGTVFISGAFGKLTFGATDSAAQNAVGQLASVGYTALSDLNETFSTTGGYLTSGDKETALYSYSASGFTGYLSVGQPDNAADTYALGATYATDAFTVAVGYEDSDSAGTAADATQTSFSASGTFSGVTAKALYAKKDTAGFDPETYGLSATYAMDAISVTGFYRQEETSATNTAYYQGIGASYSLGGGATLAGGIVNADGLTKADLGVNFSF